MIIVGEKINGMFKSIGKAVDQRAKDVIQKMAIDQIKAGATILDISPGPGLEDAPVVMEWLVGCVQEVTNVPLSIDTPDIETMEAGLSASKNPTIINSTTAEKVKMDTLFALASKYNSEIIGLTLDEKGIPSDVSKKCELALAIITTAMEYGISSDRIYLDPIVLPIGAAQDQASKLFEAITMFKSLVEPRPKTIVGLSNISNATKERSLINRTYLVMLMAHGLDAVILNPLDSELMNSLKTSEILLNKKLYCDDFLRT